MATAVESAKDGLSSGPKICPVCRETVGDDYLATDKNYFHQDCFVYVYFIFSNNNNDIYIYIYIYF